MGSAFSHLANQQVRNSHAGIRRLGFITNDGDGVQRGVFTQGFSCDHARWPGAKNDVVGHGDSLLNYKLKRLRVAAVGCPSLSQPRAA